MKTSAHLRRPSHATGAAMLLVLMLTIVGGVAVTSWMYLISSRLIQADRMTDARKPCGV